MRRLSSPVRLIFNSNRKVASAKVFCTLPLCDLRLATWFASFLPQLLEVPFKLLLTLLITHNPHWLLLGSAFTYVRMYVCRALLRAFYR